MKKIFKILFIGIVCIYVYNSYIDFKKKEIFDIVEVNVNVQNEKLVTDLIKSLKELEGRNILNIDKNEIKNELLKDIRVKSVIIEKKMPDTLYFEIEEKRPYAYVEYKNNIYISDKAGEIYGNMRESQKYNMPLIRITDPKEIKDYIEITKKIKNIESISQIYGIKNGIVVTLNTGLKIITDLDVESKKYEIAEKIYEQKKEDFLKKEDIEYIDLRFKDYVIKKVEGGRR